MKIIKSLLALSVVFITFCAFSTVVGTGIWLAWNGTTFLSFFGGAAMMFFGGMFSLVGGIKLLEAL